MARLLIEKGYREVWPLLKGFDGWLELGFPTEPLSFLSPSSGFVLAVWGLCARESGMLGAAGGHHRRRRALALRRRN